MELEELIKTVYHPIENQFIFIALQDMALISIYTWKLELLLTSEVLADSFLVTTSTSKANVIVSHRPKKIGDNR